LPSGGEGEGEGAKSCLEGEGGPGPMRVNEVEVEVEGVDEGAAIVAAAAAAAAALLHSCLEPSLASSHHPDDDDAPPRAAPAPYLHALLPYLEVPWGIASAKESGRHHRARHVMRYEMGTPISACCRARAKARRDHDSETLNLSHTR